MWPNIALSIPVETGGRFVIPARFRKVLFADCDTLIVSPTSGRGLVVYAPAEWKLIIERLMKNRRHLMHLLHFTDEVVIDRRSRIIISRYLRARFEISEWVNMVAFKNRLELYPGKSQD